MRLATYTHPYKIVFSETLAKMLLCKDIIYEILKPFSIKKKSEWEEKENCEKCRVVDGELVEKCKRCKILDIVSTTTEFCKIENYPKFGNLEGPYCSKYLVLFLNRSENLMMVINTPSIIDSTNDITDMSVKNLNIFVYGDLKIDLDFESKVKHVLDYDVLTNEKVLTSRFSKNPKEYLELIKIYDSYIWMIRTGKES